MIAEVSKILSDLNWVGRNWAAIAITLTCLSIVAWLVILLAKYVKICLNIFIDTPPPLSMRPVDFPKMEGEEIRFRSFDGTSLRGMRVRANGNENGNEKYRGTIVFCHEYGSDMHSFARYTLALNDAGFDVFTFDFRGHGQSSKSGKYKPLQWPSNRELEDTLGACAYIEDVLIAEEKSPDIGIFGISRGAGAGILAASTDDNIKAILGDSAFDTRLSLIALMKRWASIFARIKLVYEHHPEAFWQALLWLVLRFAQPKLGCKFPSVLRALKDMKPRPIFFIHGQRDSYIRESQTKILLETAPEPKYLWVVPKAKHNQAAIVEPKQYAERITAFFNKHLAGENIPDEKIDGKMENK